MLFHKQSNDITDLAHLHLDSLIFSDINNSFNHVDWELLTV